MRTKLLFAIFFVLFAHFNVQIAEAAIVYTDAVGIITFSVAKVQSLKDNKHRACIYNFQFSIAPELLTSLKISNEKRIVLNGMAESEILPDSLFSSISILSEHALSQKLNAQVFTLKRTPVHPLFGTTPSSLSSEDSTRLLFPYYSFKKALEKENCDLYIKISCEIKDSRIFISQYPSSNIRPKIVLKIKVYNNDNKLLWKNKAKAKNFGKLRMKTGGIPDGTSIVESETLKPDHIYKMYSYALKQLTKPLIVVE